MDRPAHRAPHEDDDGFCIGCGQASEHGHSSGCKYWTPISARSAKLNDVANGRTTNQEGGDPISAAPVAPMRPGAEYVCDLPGYVPGSITDLLREVTAKSFAQVKLPPMTWKPMPRFKPLTPEQAEMCDRIIESTPGPSGQVFKDAFVGVDMGKPGSDMTVAVMARYDHERGVMVTESITAGEFYDIDMMSRIQRAVDCADSDRQMAMRDTDPARHPRILEPYVDIDGREIVGPGRTRTRSWLNTSTSYRAECMVGGAPDVRE